LKNTHLHPILLLVVPLYTLLKPTPTTSENIQTTPQRQIHLSSTQLLHAIQIREIAAATSVGDGNGQVVGGESADKGFVNAALETFVVGGVDQKFGASSGKVGEVFWGRGGLALNGRRLGPSGNGGWEMWEDGGVVGWGAEGEDLVGSFGGGRGRRAIRGFSGCYLFP